MIRADLHMHSRVSDGSYTIEELAREAAAAGLDAIAVTDHDTLEGAGQIPEGLPVRVLPGIEISCFDYAANLRVHVLGYGVQDRAAVERFVHPLLLARHENSLRQIETLRRNGFSIDEGALHRANGRYIYKQHIMEYLVKTGQAPDMFGGFYRSVFKNGGICDFDIQYLNPYEAVRVLRAAGGLAVLAHPGQQQNFALIPALVRAGLCGLERNHPANSARDRALIDRIAGEQGLFLTGGSDFHGLYEKNPLGVGACLSEQSGAERVAGAADAGRESA